MIVRQLRQTKRLRKFVHLGKRETHVHRDVGFVLIFDFRFGKRRAAIEAPVHRLQTAEHVACVVDFPQSADFVGLGDRIHRGVWVFPFTENAQAHEVFALFVDLLGGIRAALSLHFLWWQAFAVLFLDLDFDRHAVAIPTGHVWRVVARH